MTGVVWLLGVPLAGLATGVGLRAAGVPRRMAVWSGLAAGAATLLAVAAVWFTAFGECLGENRSPPAPASWPWSPRREFCSDGDSPAALGTLILLLVPMGGVMLGTFLRWKAKPALGWACYAVLLATPGLPKLYLEALPTYRLDEYSILDQPLLRPASRSKPVRVCYVYGIAFGPRKVKVLPDTSRTCVELRSTPQALRLTADSDEDRTLHNLDLMGKNLTEKGLPVSPGETNIAGLVVDRAYKLPDRKARVGAKLAN